MSNKNFFCWWTFVGQPQQDCQSSRKLVPNIGLNWSALKRFIDRKHWIYPFWISYGMYVTIIIFRFFEQLSSVKLWFQPTMRCDITSKHAFLFYYIIIIYKYMHTIFTSATKKLTLAKKIFSSPKDKFFIGKKIFSSTKKNNFTLGQKYNFIGKKKLSAKKNWEARLKWHKVI